MMKWLPAVVLSLSAATAGAFELPWDQPASGKSLQYCTGFVVGGLTSKQVASTSRTDLWLAWNYIIRNGAIAELGSAPAEFQEGNAQFQTVADSTVGNDIVQQADGNCGLGRSGHQITGW